MYVPLVILAVFAVVVGFPWFPFSVAEAARAGPAGWRDRRSGVLLAELVYPEEHASHADGIHGLAEVYAFFVALAGFLLATVFYGLRWLNPDDVRAAVRADLSSVVEQVVLRRAVRRHLRAAGAVRLEAGVARLRPPRDRRAIDGLARGVRAIGQHRRLDRPLPVDGLVNVFGRLDLFDRRFAPLLANRQAAAIRDADRDRHRGP